MLTEQCFDYPVEYTRINNKFCWVYLGNDLAECVSFAKMVTRNGELFFDPLTVDVRGPHRQWLEKSMVLLLVSMQHYHQYNDVETMAYPEEFPWIDDNARGFCSNYSYLVHFGLVDKKSSGGKPHYWVTDLGRRFIEGERVRRELYNIGRLVVGHNGDSWGCFADYFNLDELLEMQQPLWFLTDERRRGILTNEELAV